MGFQADLQLVAKTSAQIQAKPGGTLSAAAVLSGEAFVEDAGQVAGGNADAVIRQRQTHGAVPALHMEADRGGCRLDGVIQAVFHGVCDQLV